MKTIIGFEDLKINCIIGLYPEERILKQDIYIDLKTQYDLSEFLKNPSINSIRDYTNLALICRQIAEKNHIWLEEFAYDVLKTILHEWDANWAWIKVKKPGAIQEAQYAFVEMEKGTKI